MTAKAPAPTEVADFETVCREVHDADFVYRYAREGATSDVQAIGYYLSDGKQSAETLDRLITEHVGRGQTPCALFEFAAGYGCVTRHLVQHDDRYSVVACDIHPEAINFLRDRLGVEALLSHVEPEKLQVEQKFDVAFALSFFSHMPPTTWRRWFDALLGTLEDGGLLIFTTHGRVAQGQAAMSTLSPEGFWFNPASEQQDLPVADYGTMIVSPRYVFDHLATLPNAKLRHYEEAYWWGSQDVYVIEKTAAEWAASRVARSTRLQPSARPSTYYPHRDVHRLTEGDVADDARLFADRLSMIRSLPIRRRGTIAEVGIELGGLSKFLLDTLDPAELVLIDPFSLHQIPILHGEPTAKVFQGGTHAEFINRKFADAAAKVTLDDRPFSAAFEAYPDTVFDMIYLSTDCGLETVCTACAIADRKLADGGILIVHNYTMADHLSDRVYGVVPAVNAFLEQRRWSIVGFALHEHLFGDIALQKPYP